MASSLWILLFIYSFFQWSIEVFEAGEITDLLRRCPDGSFGYKCKYRCRCDRDDVCDKVTGSCYGACSKGFWGPGCQLSNSCFYNVKARKYQGTLTVTSGLYQCQRWDRQTPHHHSYDVTDFPDEEMPENFCRTTKDSSRPWCYTADKRKRWEHCKVNNCNCPHGRFGDNCNRECHCHNSGEACDSIMGICESGCAPGWDGFDCQTVIPCPENMYGWDCAHRCHCKNTQHCDRFTGPTTDCVCVEGYFNSPYCEPVTRPRIIHFSNNKVNPGQKSVFNCTVAAYPTPKTIEIRVHGPSGKNISLIHSQLLDHTLYTRSSLFQVESGVFNDEKYVCSVKAVAGEASSTTVSSVYVRPVLVNPPMVIEESIGGKEIPLEWPPWNKDNGDTGDPPVLWYSIWAKRTSESSFKMYGVTLGISCQNSCNFTLTNLKPNSGYEMYIRCRRDGDTEAGDKGPSVFSRTKCDEPSESPVVTQVEGELQYNNTYPETKLNVAWEDPPKSAWNCDEILRYQILISSGQPELLVTHLSGDTHKQISIPKLEPATKYCVRIKFQNDAGYYSQESPEKCVMSPATIPSAPRNLTLLRKSSTSLTFSWHRPENTRGNLTAYTIIYWKGNLRELSTKKGVEWRSSKEIVQYTLTGLQPYRSYFVQVQAMNAAGPGEYSNVLSEITEEDVPGQIAVFKNISRSQTSIHLKWERPLKSNGEILFYYLSCRKSGSVTNPSSTGPAIVTMLPATTVEYNLSGLEPATAYACTVNASTGVGTGPQSVIKVWTEAAVPGGIYVFRNISRSETSIHLKWERPSKPNGEILFYYLSCKTSKSTTNTQGTRKIIEKKIAADTVEYNLSGLEPGTAYTCSINASTSVGSGQGSAIVVWTEASGPKNPPAPKILEDTGTTITIELRPSGDEAVSFYRILVETVRQNRIRRSRSLPDTVTDTRADFHTAAQDGDSVYVAAQLDRSTAVGQFVVGDNKTYSGFYNAPLNKDKAYHVWLGAYSYVDGGLRTSFSKAERVAVARSAITAAPPTNHVPVIIGVLVVFIVLILVFALLLFIWRKRHLQLEREKAEMPNFGPTIIPEPDPTPPSTPIDNFESEPLIEPSSADSDTDSEPVYGNIGYTVAPVKVEDLWDYVKNNKSNDCEGFRKEYKLIPAGITACCEDAKKMENKHKNRYGNIVAYDHTRVILQEGRDDEHDDYINANYIDGYLKTKAYIAAQGPTKQTLKDIWRMVWQENSRTIIMLTNPTEVGKAKCEHYWPEEESHEFAGIQVKCLHSEELPDFTTRTFLLSKDGTSREVKQFHYTTWPDHGVPKFSSSLLLLRQKIKEHDPLQGGPQIIHCSAGVGRTGTYIAIDVQLEEAKTEGEVDVHNFVQLMRTQRINMVQTLDQYVFVYDCLLEALISGDTAIKSDIYQEVLSEMCQIDPSIGKTKLEEQYDILRLITTTIERDESTSALRAENIFKNRCKNIIPANRCRPYLMTPAEGYNDYINAVFLNSYLRRDAFIITQMPLPNTVVDFWRLVYDHNSYCIVMLNEVDPTDETSEQYWTLDTSGEKFGPFIVETTAEIKSDPSVTVRDFTVTNVDLPHEVPRVVRQFHFHRWSEGSNIPSSKLALFELLEMVETWQKHTGNRPVTVHCMNGACRSGLYVAVSNVLERLRVDKEVDVFHAVKQLRLSRSQLIDNMEQYKYCHEMVLDSVNSTSNLTTFSSS